MLISWIFAALHLLALGIGLGALWTRSRALRGVPDRESIQRALTADTFLGIAALLWITTGLMRAFAGLEKGSAYYLNSPAFWLKMTLLGIILLLEVRPMVTLIGWRIQLSRGNAIDTRLANRFARTSVVQTLLVIAMVFVATAMARGIGA